MLGREVLLFTRLVLTEVPNGENQRRGLPRRLLRMVKHATDS